MEDPYFSKISSLSLEIFFFLKIWTCLFYYLLKSLKQQKFHNLWIIKQNWFDIFLLIEVTENCKVRLFLFSSWRRVQRLEVLFPKWKSKEKRLQLCSFHHQSFFLEDESSSMVMLYRPNNNDNLTCTLPSLFQHT